MNDTITTEYLEFKKAVRKALTGIEVMRDETEGPGLIIV